MSSTQPVYLFMVLTRTLTKMNFLKHLKTRKLISTRNPSKRQTVRKENPTNTERSL